MEVNVSLTIAFKGIPFIYILFRIVLSMVENIQEANTGQYRIPRSSWSVGEVLIFIGKTRDPVSLHVRN